MSHEEATRDVSPSSSEGAKPRVTRPQIHPQMASSRATIAPPPLRLTAAQPSRALLLNTAPSYVAMHTCERTDGRVDWSEIGKGSFSHSLCSRCAKIPSSAPLGVLVAAESISRERSGGTAERLARSGSGDTDLARERKKERESKAEPFQPVKVLFLPLFFPRCVRNSPETGRNRDVLLENDDLLLSPRLLLRRKGLCPRGREIERNFPSVCGGA